MIEQLIEAGKQLVQNNIAQGWGGNLSCRQDEEIVITRSGADLGNLKKTDFVIAPKQWPVADVRALIPKPSSELAMHLAAYRAQPEIRAVLHAIPPRQLVSVC